MTDEHRGKKVTHHNGTEPGADSEMVKYRFSGSPTSLFEHAPEAGEVRVLTVTAQCTNGTHGKLGADGIDNPYRRVFNDRLAYVREQVTNSVGDFYGPDDESVFEWGEFIDAILDAHADWLAAQAARAEVVES